MILNNKIFHQGESLLVEVSDQGTLHLKRLVSIASFSELLILRTGERLPDEAFDFLHKASTFS